MPLTLVSDSALKAWYRMDVKKATIQALLDYEKMLCIVKLTPDEIQTMEERMVSPINSTIGDSPRIRDPHGQELMVVNHLCWIELMQERYIQAVSFLQWFQPTWDVLSDEEQKVLHAYYISKKKKEAINNLAKELYLTHVSLNRRKHRALAHLRILLFGR